jgi:hypothetical protein
MGITLLLQSSKASRVDTIDSSGLLDGCCGSVWRMAGVHRHLRNTSRELLCMLPTEDKLEDGFILRGG